MRSAIPVTGRQPYPDLEYYFPGMRYYPRVELDGVILSLAKWQVKRGARGHSAPEVMRHELGLPRRVALTRFDQQLVFDLDKPDECRFFQDCTASMEEFSLHEFLLPPEAPAPVCSGSNCRSSASSSHSWLTPKRFTPLLSLPIQKAPACSGTSCSGSQWFYVKIYCNPAYGW